MVAKSNATLGSSQNPASNWRTRLYQIPLATDSDAELQSEGNSVTPADDTVVKPTLGSSQKNPASDWRTRWDQIPLATDSDAEAHPEANSDIPADDMVVKPTLSSSQKNPVSDWRTRWYQIPLATDSDAEAQLSGTSASSVDEADNDTSGQSQPDDDSPFGDMTLSPCRRGRPPTNFSRARVQARARYAARKCGAPKLSRGRPSNPESSRRQQRRRELRKEKALVKNAQRACMDGDMTTGCNLMTQTIHSRQGKQAFGPVANLLSQSSVYADVGRNVCKQLSTIGKSHKRAMIRLCTGNMVAAEFDMTAFCSSTGLSRRYVQSSVVAAGVTSDRLLNEKYKPCTTRVTTRGPQDQLIVDFFMDNTEISSGSQRPTRELYIGFQELMIKWYAEYPRRLRVLVAAEPALLRGIQEKHTQGKLITRFESSILSAVQAKDAPDFDEELELDERTCRAEKEYKLHLEKKRIRGMNMALGRAETLRIIALGQEGSDKDDPCSPTTSPKVANTRRRLSEEFTAASTNYTLYTPIAENKFWRVISQHKIHWTKNVNPTECKIHDEGPLRELELNAVCAKTLTCGNDLRALRARIQEATSAKQDTQHLRTTETQLSQALFELEKNSRILRDKVSHYALHLKQYEVCRSVIKAIEDKLVPGQCVLYRDFVACYNCEGQKIQNLVLVARWRTDVAAPLRTFKLNHYCGDRNSRSSDTYYVADVFDFQFGKQGGFFRSNGITHVFLSGDHGPHFSAAQTMYNESRFHSLYGIDIHLFFLCSYHAYNRCDGAGVEGKRLGKAAAKGRVPVRTSGEYARAINKSNYHNSVGYDFEQINRNTGRFPELTSDDKLNLRRMCEVKYVFSDEHGRENREEGVILCRTIPVVPGTQGAPYEVYDLRAVPPGGELCRGCSKTHQRPVRHGDSGCVRATKVCSEVYDLKERLIRISGPDPNRINEIQEDKDYKKNIRKPIGAFPCKVLDAKGHPCSHHFYHNAGMANIHMKKKHGILDGSSTLYQATGSEKPFPCKVGTCKNGYKSAVAANRHMTNVHGYAASSVDLYAVLRERRKKNVEKSTDESEEASRNSDLDGKAMLNSTDESEGESRNSDRDGKAMSHVQASETKKQPFPCKENTCKSGFRSSVAANQHMTQLQGYASVDLYVVRKRRPNLGVIAETSADESEGHSRNSDIPDGNAMLHENEAMPHENEAMLNENKATESKNEQPFPCKASKKQTRSSLKATQHLSEYELARLARMAENQEMLASLNIPSIPDVRPQKRKAKLTRKDADEDGAYKPSDDDAEAYKPEPRRTRSKRHTTG